MRGTLLWATLLASTHVAPAPLFAQAQSHVDTLQVGASVRLGLKNGGVERGRLAVPFVPGSESVVYCHFPSSVCPPADASLLVSRPSSDLARLEVRSGNQLKGSLIGGGAVLALVVVGRAVFSDRDSPAPLTTTRVLGIVTAVGLGAFVGSQIAAGWERVPIDPTAP